MSSKLGDCSIEENTHESLHEKNLSKYILEVKNILGTQNIDIPSHCDQFIARCIRVKNYDIEKAGQLVRNFGIMMGMDAMQDLYAKFKPSELKDIYFAGTITPLLKRDSLGRLIVFARASSWNPEIFDFDQTLAAFIVLINYSVAQSKEIQCSGVTFVLDFSDWTLHQIRSIKLGRLKLVAKFMQNSAPMKIKGIHFIHHPKVINVLFLLVRPFLKAKLASRIHFHESDDSLCDYFWPQFLSEALSAITSCNGCIFDREFLLDLISQDAYCQEMVKCRYPSH